MHMYYAVMIAAIVGIAIGAGVTGLMVQSTPKAFIVTEVDVTGNMEVFKGLCGPRPSIRSAELSRPAAAMASKAPPKGRIVISVFDSFRRRAVADRLRKILPVAARDVRAVSRPRRPNSDEGDPRRGGSSSPFRS